MNLFYAATKISVGNGAKTPFWDVPWLDGENPKEIAPLIYMSSKRKSWNVKAAMHNHEWAAKIEGSTEFNYEHVVQFVKLWTNLERVHLDKDIEDGITWTLSANGEYFATSAYKAQFFGASSTNMNTMVWKVWAPPKTKSLAWLALKNRLWTVDRLEREGGQIVGYVLCARESQNRWHTSLRIVGSP
jgi:hypothetical protein